MLIFFAQSLVIGNIVASEEQTTSFSYDIMQHVVTHVNCFGLKALKLTRKDFNLWCNYHSDMFSLDFIREIPQEICTKALTYFADMQQEKNFVHFFMNNNGDVRKEALTLLGWNEYSTEACKNCMQAYQGIVNVEMLEQNDNFNFDTLFKNVVALHMFCVSPYVNMCDKSKMRALAYAALNGKVEIVKLLLHNKDIDPTLGGNFNSIMAKVALKQRESRVYNDIAGLMFRALTR